MRVSPAVQLYLLSLLNHVDCLSGCRIRREALRRVLFVVESVQQIAGERPTAAKRGIVVYGPICFMDFSATSAMSRGLVKIGCHPF